MQSLSHGEAIEEIAHSEPEKQNRVNSRLTFPRAALLFGITAAAMGVHGYHPYVEDAEIYLPGIKKLLNPALYPQNAGFFASHAGLTLFPNLIAASVRITHIPFDTALLIWQVLCIFGLLFACWRIGCIAFRDTLASWGGVSLVAAMLTIPIAGTSLYLMDQYLNTRSLSAAMVMTMIANTEERRYVRTALWALLTATIHPLMAVFGIAFVSSLCMVRMFPELMAQRRIAVGALLPLGLFPPMSSTYHQALQSRSYFFLSRWEWYELLGMVAPFAIFWLYGRAAAKRGLPELETTCTALNIFGLVFALVSLMTIPSAFERFTLLQPMRYLHLTYILLFVFAGGFLTQFLLQRHVWRWVFLFVPMCAGMFFAQRALFPATSHLELPGRPSSNPWVQAFLWIRQNTPTEAYFALNPEHMKLAGEDQHGFRALAERSMLADNVKDSGAVTMFPKMAETWKEQSSAQAGWNGFQRSDLLRLQRTYGVNWVVLENPAIAGLQCPYRNERLSVCRIE
jgi:hypothetical protein